MKPVLFGLLVLVALWYGAVWLRDLAARRRAGERLLPSLIENALGFVTNFFDTLGIGSFAPTTSVFRLRGLVPDEKIPGTLNVGHTPPVIAQAFIFVTLVAIDPVTLVVLIAAAVLGAWLGAGVVTHWPRDRIRRGMGLGLLVAGLLMVLKNLDELRGVPMFQGGEAIGLDPPLLVLAAALNFVLGAVVTLGIGNYAPSLIMISLLGMNPLTAWPIMMGACAFLMPMASVRFVRAGRYQPAPALGLALGGLPAVLIAGLLVKSLPLTTVRWLVVVVVLYTAFNMLRRQRATEPSPAA